MKKLTLILAFIGMIGLTGCRPEEDDVDFDTISEVFEYNTNVNFTSANNYSVVLNYPHPIYSSDMVLLYRLDGTVNGQDVWKLMPQTFYFDDGTLDFRYDFNFTTTKANVFLEGFDLEGISTDFRINQIIRVVIIPAYFGKSAHTKLDYSDYNDVVKEINIDESKIKIMK